MLFVGIVGLVALVFLQLFEKVFFWIENSEIVETLLKTDFLLHFLIFLISMVLQVTLSIEKSTFLAFQQKEGRKKLMSTKNFPIKNHRKE